MVSLADIGYHESNNRQAMVPALKDGVRTFQVFLGAPQTFQSKPLEEQLVQMSSEVTLIGHGPFVTSLLADSSTKMYQGSCKYYNDLTANCLYSGIHKLVIHPGAASVNSTERESKYYFESFIDRWLNDNWSKDITLCFENSPGSSTGRNMASLAYLYDVVSRVDNPHIRIAFDTEHAFANGFSLKKERTISKVLDYTDVLHFNAIPHYVERGSHLDRHSNTHFDDSHYNLDVYKRILDCARSKGHRISVILERENWEVAKHDYLQIKEWLNG